MQRATGFSLIELVVVLVLIGIVGVSIISRIMSPNVFNEIATHDSIIAVLRTAQQSALGRSNITAEIDQVGNDWVITAKEGGTVIRSVNISSRNVVLETGSAVASANTCANSFNTAVAADFELVFDNLGNLAEFSNNGSTELVDSSFNGVRICVNDTVASSVCVSPAGYASSGNCDE